MGSAECGVRNGRTPAWQKRGMGAENGLSKCLGINGRPALSGFVRPFILKKFTAGRVPTVQVFKVWGKGG
jgi:hypothetical protein